MPMRPTGTETTLALRLLGKRQCGTRFFLGAWPCQVEEASDTRNGKAFAGNAVSEPRNVTAVLATAPLRHQGGQKGLLVPISQACALTPRLRPCPSKGLFPEGTVCCAWVEKMDSAGCRLLCGSWRSTAVAGGTPPWCRRELPKWFAL